MQAKAESENKVVTPPPSDEYYEFIAWVVNKVSFVLYAISYIIATMFLVFAKSGGWLWSLLYARDALLSWKEIADGMLPGVSVTSEMPV